MSLNYRPTVIIGVLGSGSLALGIVLANPFLIGIGALAAIFSLGYQVVPPVELGQKKRTMNPEFPGRDSNQWSEQSPDESSQWQPRSNLVQQTGVQLRSQQSAPGTRRDDGPEPDNTQSQDTTSVDLSELRYRWETETDVSFEDIGGMVSIKQEIRRDVIKPLTTHREQAEKLGVSASNVVFYGPPGTGKSHLAQAVATELGYPVTQLSGADVQSKWINESAQKIQALFDEAKQIAADEGGAVVFLDELDSVLKSRGAQNTHEEDNKIVNEFLNYLESTSDHNIVFIGASNRLEALDEAGIRSGRIDKMIHIGFPNRRDRKDILRVQLSDRPNALSEDHIEQVAGWTQGSSAADLEQLIEDAARASLDRGSDRIIWPDIRRIITVESDTV